MRSPNRFAVWITAALLLALLVRWLVTLRYYRELPLGPTDNFFYHSQANLLAEGRGFINPFAWLEGRQEPTAAHPPLYSLYLAAWSLLGADTALWHRLASGLVSAAVVVPVALVTARLAGRRAGVLAGFAAALYPPLWMNDGLILSESFYLPIAGLTIWQAHRFADDPRLGRAVGLALVLTTGALTRSEPLLLFGVLAVPLVLSRRQLRLAERWRLLGVIALIAAVLLAPWVGRNLAIFEEPTFLAVGPGYVLELGNCDDTYSGPLLGYWSAGCDSGDWPEGDESTIGAHKLAIARGYIFDHLSEQPKVVAARVGRLLGLFRPFQTADYDVFFERRIERFVAAGVWLHWLLSAAALWGVVLLRRRGESLWPTLAMVAVAAWTAALTFGVTRYRIAADVAVVVLACVAIGAWLDRLRPSPDEATQPASANSCDQRAMTAPAPAAPCQRVARVRDRRSEP